jgi:YVTN family beta-propeller protein
LALTHDGRKLYVANGRSNSVSVIDTMTLQVLKTIPVGELPWGVTIP